MIVVAGYIQLHKTNPSPLHIFEGSTFSFFVQIAVKFSSSQSGPKDSKPTNANLYRAPSITNNLLAGQLTASGGIEKKKVCLLIHKVVPRSSQNPLTCSLLD
jgi:hypothetical protein